MFGRFKYIFSKIQKKFRISSIKNSTTHKTSKVESNSSFINSTLNRNSFVGHNSFILNTTIGSFCSLADNVIVGGANHPIDWVSTSPVFYYGRDSIKKKYSTFKRKPDKKTIIGNDVWVGNNAIIKQGVIIGDGAVIGMGAIVTKNVPNYAIVAGNPAKIIRMHLS